MACSELSMGMTVAIGSQNYFSLCHGYHSQSHKFVGVKVPIHEIGSHSVLSMLRYLALSRYVLMLTEETPQGTNRPGLTITAYQRSTDKAIIHS